VYHLNDPTHRWDIGVVYVIYIGSAADGVFGLD